MVSPEGERQECPAARASPHDAAYRDRRARRHHGTSPGRRLCRACGRRVRGWRDSPSVSPYQARQLRRNGYENQEGLTVHWDRPIRSEGSSKNGLWTQR
eukprot:969674-Alexandrium_andersonii.AAC.1